MISQFGVAADRLATVHGVSTCLAQRIAVRRCSVVDTQCLTETLGQDVVREIRLNPLS